MKQRTVDILRLLLERKDFIAVGEFAEILGVSSKTISRELPKVETELEKIGLELEKKSGAGIKISGSEVKCHALSEKIKLMTKREYTPMERLSFITAKLLQSREPIKLFALSYGLNVTDSTISNDLDKLEPEFKSWGLKLIRKPGLGVGLLGNEQNLRRATVRYIYEHIGEEKLLRLIGENFEDDEENS